MDGEKQTVVERIMWGLPPVLLAWMFCYGLVALALVYWHD
jgi:hypothetical protein